MPKPISECKTVAELLEDPSRWTQGAFARSESGNQVRITSDAACKFCLASAVDLVYGFTELNCSAKKRLLGVIGREYGGIFDFNDFNTRTHAEVLEAVKKAGI